MRPGNLSHPGNRGGAATEGHITKFLGFARRIQWLDGSQRGEPWHSGWYLAFWVWRWSGFW